tara:strand:+ start:217 stop:444 length:228 start_codon:yes stop_codon:yes gene_type:complete
MINKKRLRKMKKQSLSIRTKILVSLMLLFTLTMLVATFTDIIKENNVYEVGFWVANLGWMASMYFDGKKGGSTQG